MNPSASAPKRQKLFVIAKRSGRLGNQLLLYAHIIAYAEEHAHRVVNTAFYGNAHLFETTRRDIYGRYPLPVRPSIFDANPDVASRLRKWTIFYRGVKYLSLLNYRLPLLGGRIVTFWEFSAHVQTSLDDPAMQKKLGRKVEERAIRADDLIAAQRSGELKEAFACGTCSCLLFTEAG